MKNNVLDMLPHNVDSYDKINKAFLDGERFVALLHATGTGKTFNALQLALDNPNIQILFVTPYNSIIEHIKEVIKENPNLDIDKDFKNVKFVTYAGLSKLSKEEQENLDVDMMILDEFHHIGAPVWGETIENIIDTHPNLKVFGMSAYSVRDRGTQYERDLAEDGGNEIFSDAVVSRYDLVEAMLDGVLSVPIYKSSYTDLEVLTLQVEESTKRKYASSPLLTQKLKVLSDIKRKIAASQVAHNVLIDNIKKDGKYIYFCPPMQQENANNIETIMDETKKSLLSAGYKEEDICFYVTTSDDSSNGRKNREAFYNDIDLNGESTNGKLRIMFAINQYNEGVHAPNVDGVILGRGTKSDIVFYEQVGRGLQVRGNTYGKISELQKLDIDNLITMCKERNVAITNDMSKDDIIERLVAPIIIDLAGNIAFMKDLITDLKHRMRVKVDYNNGHRRMLHITDHSYILEVLNQDLFDTLIDLKSEFDKKTWEESYALARNYYDKYGNLRISRKFKSDDGVAYYEYGYALGEWITYMRRCYSNKELSEEQIDALNKIGMKWSIFKSFDDSYNKALKYKEKYGHLRVPYNYVTDDGYALGTWIVNQRRKYKLHTLSESKIKKLNDIGMVWVVLKTFDESLSLAKRYKEKYGHINIPKDYLVDDDLGESKDGYNLGRWLYNQKRVNKCGKLSIIRKQLLDELEVDWDIPDSKDTLSWDEMYELAKNYYDTYHNLNIKRSFVTFDGINEDPEGYGLGRWISRQRVCYKNGKLDKKQIEKLNLIEFKWNDDVTYKSWDDSYKYALDYFITNGNLNIRTDYKTSDGYGLGPWIYLQRKKFASFELDDIQIQKLNLIGMIWNVSENHSKIKEMLREEGVNYRKYIAQVKHLSYYEFMAKLNFIKKQGFKLVNNSELHEIFNMSSIDIKIKYGVTREDILCDYLGYEKKV